MNFGKCCKCGSNKDVVYFHTEEREPYCYECLKEYYKDDMEIIHEDGKELYYWKSEEDDYEPTQEIKEDNVINFANELYYASSHESFWIPCVEECFYCEVCADEMGKKEIMFVVYDEKYKEEYTICPECFTKINGIKKVIFEDAEYSYNRKYSFVYGDDIVVENFESQHYDDVENKIFDYCVNKLNIELVEEEVIKTELTDFWTHTPKFYKVLNRTYSDIDTVISKIGNM